MRKSALITASVFIGLASLVAGGITANASSIHAPKAAGTASFTFNLLGAPITVGVTTGADGSLADVVLAPATGFTPTAVANNKVSFTNVAGTTSVTVRANHGGQSVTVRSTNLADLIGANGWTGDVFGSGKDTSVAFDISEAGGVPTISLPACNPAPDVTSCDVTPAVVGHDTDDNEGSSASASVLFTNIGGATRTLRIRVGMHTEDGNTQAVVRMSLSKIKEADIVGFGLGKIWNGTDCLGAPLGPITYDVAEDGTLTVTPAAGQTVSAGDNGGQTVTFTTGEQVRISTTGTGATMVTRIRVKLHCSQNLPTINGSAADPSVVSGDDDGDGDGDHGDQSDDNGSDNGSDHGSDTGNGGSGDVNGHG